MHYAEAALVYRIVARRSMAADSGRLREACAPERTGSGRSPSDTSYRVAKRSFDRSSARRSCPQVPQCHPRVAKGTSIGTLARGPSTEALLGQGRVPKGRKSVPLQGLRSSLRPGLARHPRLQIVLRQDRVAKWSSIGTLARGPSTEALLWQGSVAKGRKSVLLAGFWSGSRSGSARHPRLQVVLRQGRVAKGTSIGTLARGPSTEALLGLGRVAKGRKSVPLTGLWSGSRPGSARHPRLQVVLSHPRVAKRASIGTLARGPLTEALMGQGRVAKGRKLVPLPGLWSGSRPGSARHLLLQVVLSHPRVAKRASIGTLARGPSTEALLGQGRVPKERESVPLTGLWSGSRPG